MDPFDRRPFGLTGDQMAYDRRRLRYLECIVKRAYVNGEALDRWDAKELAENPVDKPDGDPPEKVSGMQAGYLTACDAAAELGIEHLDEGLIVTIERRSRLSPPERDRLLRAELMTKDDRHTALARALLVRACPDRADELFGWQRVGVSPVDYWTKQVTSVHMQYLLETADFGANELIRHLYLLGETPAHLTDVARLWRDAEHMGRDPNFPSEAEAVLRSQYTSFKYWWDDPFRCDEFTGHALAVRGQANVEARAVNPHEAMSPGRDMTYWSENHRLLFAAAEYLAGQYWPDDMFVSARQHRTNPAPRHGDMTGQQHVAHARTRVLRWLNERLELGFAEWNAPGYYAEDLLPLVNLADFAGEEEIRTRAAMVLDLLAYDIAVSSCGGAFAGSAGRAYFEQKSCVWRQSVRDSAEVLFGAKGHFTGSSGPAVFLATSPVYRPPDVLLRIASVPPSRFTNHARVSIDFHEAKDYGVGFETSDDMEFWWSRAAFATKQTIVGSRKAATEAGLLKTPPFDAIFEKFSDLTPSAATQQLGASGAGAMIGWAFGGPAGGFAGGVIGGLYGLFSEDIVEADMADLASVISEGSVLSRANVYQHRIDGALLSSVQNYRPGQLNLQNWPCVAALGNGAMVWTTYPSAGSRLKFHVDLPALPVINVDEPIFAADHDGPNWWTGNAVQPRVAQRRGAAIIAYQAKKIQKLLFGERTHAWFPKNQFDEVRGPAPANCNHEAARWFFGQAGDGYVGLLCPREANWADFGPWKDKEIRAEGPRNIFVMQIGNAEEFGTFDGFVTAVSRARVYISGLHNRFGDLACHYDIPNADRLELHYDDNQVRYAGLAFNDTEFPRLRSPFGRITWRQQRYAIQHDGESVVHDVTAGTRKVGKARTALEHDTPLLFYGQNMALLPSLLYKGIDRDGVLEHLLSVLRTRQPDVVGLSEMWVAEERERLQKQLRDLYPYMTEGPHEADLPILDEDVLSGGGLLLLSRHPIVASHQTVYRACSGDDCATNKGVLHARVQSVGHPCAVDVFLTHAQAPAPTVGGSRAKARKAVRAQIQQLAAFIAGCRDLTAPAIALGDFNVDRFSDPELYDYLVSALGYPHDTEPSMPTDSGFRRLTATSESDEGVISSFHKNHPARQPDDPARFSVTSQRLDYLFSFAGALYTQNVASARVVLEQWRSGRDMSDHYGIEATIDTTTQLLPAQQPINQVSVRATGFRCLTPTGGIGDDEVQFRVSARASTGAHGSVVLPRYKEVAAGTARGFETEPIVFGDPGEDLAVVGGGKEIDTFVDDSLGATRLELERDVLLALQGKGSTAMSLPLLTGEGEYVLDLAITVQ
ncbi:endonuclease/exonuclease/phosphatase family protein [Actinomadura sp. KC06]|uniref:endonuclease/exonuclease/phosphatase family protein n=1 Tax=Actinomadura sp. KC06 TaxID=2530369 RepID=UPI0014053159|nr:endonuclease/exonuclease/phosphatase family protein [Actinomadura sp. KC06]